MHRGREGEAVGGGVRTPRLGVRMTPVLIYRRLYSEPQRQAHRRYPPLTTDRNGSVGTTCSFERERHKAGAARQPRLYGRLRHVVASPRRPMHAHHHPRPPRRTAPTNNA